MLWWPLFTAARHAVVAGPARSCWAPTARRSSTSSRRPRSPRSPRRSSTRCAARPTGCRTSTPTSRAGNDLIRQFYLALNSGVVLLLGLVGLLHAPQPAPAVPGCRRRWSDCCMVTMGHLGARAGLVRGRAATRCSTVRSRRCATCTSSTRSSGCRWCSGWLAGRRMSRSGARRPRPSGQLGEPPSDGRRRVNQYVVGRDSRRSPSLGARCPPWPGRIDSQPAGSGVPDYWPQAADWLGADEPATALLVPGSSFGHYVWGSPRDEPLQSLGRSRGRSATPCRWHPAGNIRMLDAIEARVWPGPRLARAGVATSAEPASPTSSSATTWPRSATSPTRCWCTRRSRARPGSSGSRPSAPTSGGRRTSTGGRRPHRHQRRLAERVPGHRDLRGRRQTTVAAAATARHRLSSAGPRTCSTSRTSDCSATSRPQLAADVDTGDRSPGSPVVLTDGLRAVERNFGRVHDGASATSEPGEARRLGNPTRDYVTDGR